MTKKKKAKAKKTKATAAAPVKYMSLPTPERLLRANGAISMRNNIAQVDEPLRIDKLRRNGIIDDMQHLYGLQIITLWTITSRPLIRAAAYDRVIAQFTDFNLVNVSRMSAEDQFYKTLSCLKSRDYALICKICFEEKGAIEAGMSLKLPINSITFYVRLAFDHLGEALAKMRKARKEFEAPPEEAGEEMNWD